MVSSSVWCFWSRVCSGWSGMGLGGGKMTRATGTSTKTTSLSRAGVASGKTGMTGANGCLKVMVLESGQNRCLLEACQNLQQWVQSLPPVPAEFQNSAEVQNSAEISHQEGTTPGPTEVESKDESSSSESSMDVEDPRKTRSEPPPSPRPNASTGLPVEGIPMGTAMEVTCENGEVVGRPVATATAPPTHVEQPVPVGGLPVEGSIQSSVGSSWVPVEETPTEASFNVLDGMETVASEVLEEEEKA